MPGILTLIQILYCYIQESNNSDYYNDLKVIEWTGDQSVMKPHSKTFSIVLKWGWKGIINSLFKKTEEIIESLRIWRSVTFCCYLFNFSEIIFIIYFSCHSYKFSHCNLAIPIRVLLACIKLLFIAYKWAFYLKLKIEHFFKIYLRLRLRLGFIYIF